MNQKSETNLFERATREDTKFPAKTGYISVSDLWKLPLQSSTARANLNDTAITINTELKSLTEDSFVATSTNPRREELTFQLEVVKYVIAVKQAENAAAVDAANKRALRQRLQEELAERQDGKLKTLSEDELKAQLAALDG